MIYMNIFPTPMRRADLNSAREIWTTLATTPGVKAPRKIPLAEYGKQGGRLTDEQIEEVLQWNKKA